MYIHAKSYDACFLLLAIAKSDARTLNLARTLVRNGKAVCIIALGNPDDAKNFKREGIDAVLLKGRAEGRLVIRWLLFAVRAVGTLFRIKARTYWAEDVYTLPIAQYVAKRDRAALVYDSREIYSALGSLHARPRRQAILTALERRGALKAKHILVTGNLDADHLRQTLPGIVQPAVVMNLPPYAKPRVSNRLRERFSIPEPVHILLYQGMLCEGRGIETVLHAMKHAPNSALCLAGAGEYRMHLDNLIDELGLAKRVHFCGLLPYDELPEWTASADIGLALIEPISLSYRLALPNKLFEYCMAGIPTLASDLPAMQDVIQRYGIGECIDHAASPEALGTVLTSMLIHERLERYREKCHTAARELCWDSQESTILTLTDG